MRRGDGVDAAHRQCAQDRFAEAGDPRLATRQRAANGATYAIEPGPPWARERALATGDVDSDHGPLSGARHRRDREIVEHATVDEQLAVPRGHRWQHARDGCARIECVGDRSGAVYDRLARDQVDALAEEAQRQFLDEPPPERLGEQPPSLGAAEQ